MRGEHRILLVAGARPNFMKVAPVLAALREWKKHFPSLEPILVHTGQHYSAQMSEDFFRDLELAEPDIHLGIGSGTHAEQTARAMVAFEKCCLDQRPNLVIVVGDVNSTLACALVAKKLGIPVAHVEAGLRSRDMGMPEEINRVCTDAISDYLFTTEPSGNVNLKAEGIAESRIFFVGNTMIDSLRKNLPRARELPVPFGLHDNEYVVLTLHRPGNVDDTANLERLTSALNAIAQRIPVVFPVHPRTAQYLSHIPLHRHLMTTEPMGYLAFLNLMSRARMVLTDSGGIQEETTVLGVRCLTIRNTTERPITCEIGTNVLVGTDPQTIRDTALRLLDDGPPVTHTPEKWDGRAAERIADVLIDFLLRPANPADACDNGINCEPRNEMTLAGLRLRDCCLAGRTRHGLGAEQSRLAETS